MSLFTFAFLLMLFLATSMELFLDRRQLRTVATHRDTVPNSFAEQITLTEHQKAADYTASKVRMGIWQQGYATLLLLGWTLGGGLEWVDAQWRTLDADLLWQGVGFILSVMFLMAILDLPFGLYRTFRIEKRFGFNRITPALYLRDLLKNILLSLAIGLPLIALVLWLMAHAGPLWWFYVWLVWMGFSLLMMWAYPAIIAPMFNTFTPLDDVALRERIENLLTRTGFSPNGIFVMDGSRRSSHGNAYFSGLGNHKQIVFFDTLLESLNQQEIEAVLAHELGHFRRRHILKRIIQMFFFTFIALALLGWLITQEWFYHGLGVSTPSVHAALVLFMLIAPIFTFFIQPLLAMGSRKHEFEADAFAVEHTSVAALISALVKLYRDNATTLTPDKWYSAFHDSHPPAPVRIARLATAHR